MVVKVFLLLYMVWVFFGFVGLGFFLNEGTRVHLVLRYGQTIDLYCSIIHSNVSHWSNFLTYAED